MSVEPAESAAENVLLNPVVKNICTLAARAHKKGWMITLTAPTGVGKTRVIAYADRTLPFPHLTFYCKSITTRHELIRMLGLAPGEKWTIHGRNWMRTTDLFNRAVERIRQQPLLLIVDEADRPRADCFETLRDFWDETRLPMLLVGNEILTEKLNRQHDRLSRRIRVRCARRSCARFWNSWATSLPTMNSRCSGSAWGARRDGRKRCWRMPVKSPNRTARSAGLKRWNPPRSSSRR